MVIGAGVGLWGVTCAAVAPPPTAAPKPFSGAAPPPPPPKLVAADAEGRGGSGRPIAGSGLGAESAETDRDTVVKALVPAAVAAAVAAEVGGADAAAAGPVARGTYAIDLPAPVITGKGNG